MVKKKGPDAVGQDGSATNGPSLVICRNKHWRYISCYHGPWFQLPPELLQSLAHENYCMPRPRLIDPAVFFDLGKIRRAVDEATEDAVRANCGTSTPVNGSRYDPFMATSQPASKMSRERIHKVRQKAVKLLAHAYALDEVATSVVTMQSSSALEDVAEHVLRRDKTDVDARYVHFFHEKVPSRNMEMHTPLEPLLEVIMRKPFESQAAPLRTKGLVEIMKGELDAAIQDFTSSLQIAQEIRRRHKPGADQLVLAKVLRKEQGDWARHARSLHRLNDEDQPSSMEQQCHFNRAGVYLSLACDNVPAALQEVDEAPDGSTGHDRQTVDKALEEKYAAQKRLKTYAKRAWKDYLAFIGSFDYTPGYPVDMARELMKRVGDLAGDSSRRRSSALNDGQEQHPNGSLVRHQKDQSKFDFGTFPSPEIYTASMLFAEKPIPNLPPFSGQKSSDEQASAIPGVRESVTYHPLLTDAVHSLLLCHCLLQTSPTELNRHAHSAARLARIADGYPIFQAPRSPARADWIEVLRRSDNWIKLEAPWPRLCEAPSPPMQQMPVSKSGNGSLVHRQNGHGPSDVAAQETLVERQERIKNQVVLDALGDERVVDEETFRKSVQARERQALLNEKTDDAMFKRTADEALLIDDIEAPSSASKPDVEDGEHRRPDRDSAKEAKGWSRDEAGREYPVISDRAQAIVRWIKEAPSHVSGASAGGKRKKRGGAARKKGAVSVDGTAQRLQAVDIAAGEEKDMLD